MKTIKIFRNENNNRKKKKRAESWKRIRMGAELCYGAEFYCFSLMSWVSASFSSYYFWFFCFHFSPPFFIYVHLGHIFLKYILCIYLRGSVPASWVSVRMCVRDNYLEMSKSSIHSFFNVIHCAVKVLIYEKYLS